MVIITPPATTRQAETAVLGATRSIFPRNSKLNRITHRGVIRLSGNTLDTMPVTNAVHIKNPAMTLNGTPTSSVLNVAMFPRITPPPGIMRLAASMSKSPEPNATPKPR